MSVEERKVFVFVVVMCALVLGGFCLMAYVPGAVVKAQEQIHIKNHIEKRFDYYLKATESSYEAAATLVLAEQIKYKSEHCQNCCGLPD